MSHSHAKKRRLFLLGSAISVLSLVVSVLPSSAKTKEVGVSATEIVLGMQLPQSGPASPGYNKIDDAMRAYFDYVNSKGGVNGRKIRLEVRDDEYKAGKTISTLSSLINRDKVFAMVGSVGTQTQISVIADLNRRKIPHIFVNSGYSGFYTSPTKYPTTFGGLGTYVVEAKILGKYLKETYPGKKIGIIYQTDDFGRNVVAGLADQGLTFEKNKTAATFIAGTHGTLGLANQVKVMKDNGIEIVIFSAVASATAVALSTAAQLQYKPEKWAVISVGSDATTFQTILGARGVAPAVSASFLKGVLSASHAPSPGDEEDEFVKKFKEINAEFNKADARGKAWDNNVLHGMNIAYQTVHALYGTEKEYKSLTRANLIKYLENFGSKIPSAAYAPLGYSKSTHEAFTGFWLGEYDANLVLQPVGGKRTVYTTDSAKGPISVLNYTRPKLPADAISRG